MRRGWKSELAKQAEDKEAFRKQIEIIWPESIVTAAEHHWNQRDSLTVFPGGHCR